MQYLREVMSLLSAKWHESVFLLWKNPEDIYNYESICDTGYPS